MKSKQTELCVICGTHPATTRDHIPPKGIFPKPRPSDLVTVPACAACNNSTSSLDESFKVFIGIAAGHGAEGEKMFREQTSRTLDHNRRLKRDIASTLRNVWAKTPEGVVLGTRPAVLLDSKAHDTIVEKTIRGLHFHHSGVILGDRVDFTVNWHYHLTDEMYAMSAKWLTGNIGEGKLVYKYIMMPQEPLASVWIFQFFGKAWSSGTALPKGTKPGRTKHRRWRAEALVKTLAEGG